MGIVNDGTLGYHEKDASKCGSALFANTYSPGTVTSPAINGMYTKKARYAFGCDKSFNSVYMN